MGLGILSNQTVLKWTFDDLLWYVHVAYIVDDLQVEFMLCVCVCVFVRLCMHAYAYAYRDF